MTKLESKISYLTRMNAAVPYLVRGYVKLVQNMLPEVSAVRIKNARAGIVEDVAVLEAVEKLAAQERTRRVSAARAELATHGALA